MKNELRDIISGKSKVSNGAIIQSTTCYLKGSQGTSRMAKSEKHFKEKETEILKDYINKNSLWLSEINYEEYISEGAEQRVYLMAEKFAIKLNDAIYYNSWEDYLNNLLLHNYFFPDTAYNLLGFTEESKYDKNILYAVVEQPFVKATSPTNLQSVKIFLANNGFLNTKNNDYFNPELGIILEDLHDENVLTKNDMLMFIDTVFYLTEEFFIPEK